MKVRIWFLHQSKEIYFLNVSIALKRELHLKKNFVIQCMYLSLFKIKMLPNFFNGIKIMNWNGILLLYFDFT